MLLYMGEDAGKSFRLDFGDLWGILGHFINIEIGESLGEWKSSNSW